MSVIRVNKTKDYTVMSNCHLRDTNLSLKAKGLLSMMLALPEDWDYSISGLVSICKEKETAVTSALDELKTYGYLKVTKLMPNETENGRFGYCYDVFEKPIESSEKQGVEKQGVEKQGVENLGLEIQGVENQGQLNTNKLSTKELNTKDVKKERKKATAQSSYNEILDSMVIVPKLKEALIEFIKMRKLSKKPPTDHALELLIKKLYKLSSDPQTQIAIVEQSILNNWQAFYPLKLDDKNKNGYSERGTSRDKQYSELEQRLINFGSRSE